MKACNRPVLLMNTLFALLIVILSCKKADVNKNNSASFVPPTDSSSVIPPLILPLDTANIPSRDSVVQPYENPPVAFAGVDQSVQLPLDYITLNGSYTAPNQFNRSVWKQISGPSCYVKDPYAISTKVIELLEGICYFELTVFDKRNLFGKDTIVVRVKPDMTVGQNFVIFNSRTWSLPWYSTLEVRDIYSYIPEGIPIKVSVQRGSSNAWIEVPPVSPNPNNYSYEYFIVTGDGAGMYVPGSLCIFYYGSDISDHPKIKVEF